ncbi:MAG: hypothetical protein ACOY30_00275 [Bacillota bacterium]
MLSERELMELGDRIMHHVSLLEKYGVYAQQCPDPQVREVITRHQQVIQNHYNTMVGFVQNAQNVSGGIPAQAQWRLS